MKIEKKTQNKYKTKSMKLYNISILTILVCEMKSTGNYWFKEMGGGVVIINGENVLFVWCTVVQIWKFAEFAY